jgi:hypothetical protein
LSNQRQLQINADVVLKTTGNPFDPFTIQQLVQGKHSFWDKHRSGTIQSFFDN